MISPLIYKPFNHISHSEQVIELLKLGHAVGAHSIDHPRYADLSLEEQLHQTRDQRQICERAVRP